MNMGQKKTRYLSDITSVMWGAVPPCQRDDSGHLGLRLFFSLHPALEVDPCGEIDPHEMRGAYEANMES